MPAIIAQRPSAQEHAPYYRTYIDLVPAGDLVDIAERQIGELRTLMQPVTDAQSLTRYAEDKWSVREVIGHLIDTERVFAYRATAFSRGDTAPLPGFDQAEWTPMGGYHARTLADLLDEWEAARRSTWWLMRSMPDGALARRGVASENEVSVLALLAIIPGLVRYHMTTLMRDYFSTWR